MDRCQGRTLVGFQIVIFLWAFAFSSALSSTPSSAAVITVNDFSPNAIVESFEGLSDHPDVALSDREGFLDIPATLSLDSDIHLRYRFTPPQAVSHIGDFSLGDPLAGFAGNYSELEATHVPDGTAFLAVVTVSSLVIDFPTPARKIGMFALTNVGASARLLDSDGNEITTLQLGQVDRAPLEPDLWPSRFIGFDHEPGIARIEFSGSACRAVGGCGETSLVDYLIYEPIPEPASLAILITGGLMVSRRNRNHNHNPRPTIG